MTGRPRTRILVEECHPLTLRDLAPREVREDPSRYSLSLTFASGHVLTFQASSLLVRYEQHLSWAPGHARLWLLRCPRCWSRRRALYVVGAQLACRVCHGLRYQSWSERWDYPLAEILRQRCEELARKTGPKGRRYRMWARRAERVTVLASQWLQVWSRRAGKLFPRAEPVNGNETVGS